MNTPSPSSPVDESFLPLVDIGFKPSLEGRHSPAAGRLFLFLQRILEGDKENEPLRKIVQKPVHALAMIYVGCDINMLRFIPIYNKYLNMTINVFSMTVVMRL